MTSRRRLTETLRAGSGRGSRRRRAGAGAQAQGRRRRKDRGYRRFVVGVAAVLAGARLARPSWWPKVSPREARQSSLDRNRRRRRGRRWETWRNVRDRRAGGPRGYGSRITWCVNEARARTPGLGAARRRGRGHRLLEPQPRVRRPVPGRGGLGPADDPPSEQAPLKTRWSSLERPRRSCPATVDDNGTSPSGGVPTRRTAREIIDSARTVDESDGSGCAPGATTRPLGGTRPAR